jgi:LemA protein
MVNILTIVVAVLVLLVLAGLAAYVVSMYNRLVRVDERVDNAWADIDVLLKQRRDAIEKLVDTARETMDFEQEMLTDIVKAREQAQQASTPEEQAAAGEMIKQALGGLNVRAEDHPEPQAVQNMQSLQDEIASIEEKIADRREVYNEAVTAHNQLIRQIPYVLLANPLGFTARELYDPPESETTDVDVGQMFSEGEGGGQADAAGS